MACSAFCALLLALFGHSHSPVSPTTYSRPWRKITDSAAETATAELSRTAGHNARLRGSSFLDGSGESSIATNWIVPRPMPSRPKAVAGNCSTKRALDAEPHLPTALGAAIEVQAQVLAAGESLPRRSLCSADSLVAYRNTSIQTRLQKNLNVLALTGQPAPPLTIAPYLGPKPVTLAELKAPRCCFSSGHTGAADCKAEGPMIARIRSEFGARGLMSAGSHAALRIQSPRRRCRAEGRACPTSNGSGSISIPGCKAVPVPVSKENFSFTASVPCPPWFYSTAPAALRSIIPARCPTRNSDQPSKKWFAELRTGND